MRALGVVLYSKRSENKSCSAVTHKKLSSPQAFMISEIYKIMLLSDYAIVLDYVIVVSLYSNTIAVFSYGTME